MSPKEARAVALAAPLPEYPMLARRANLTGSGIFVLNIDPQTGAVDSITVVKRTGHGVLDAAAMEAFIKWRFKPHSVSRVQIPISFTMNGQTQTTPRYRAF